MNNGTLSQLKMEARHFAMYGTLSPFLTSLSRFAKEVAAELDRIEDMDKAHMETASMVASLMVEHDAMREALEFYADLNNNDWDVDAFDEVMPSQVMVDGGQRARDVIASLQGTESKDTK